MHSPLFHLNLSVQLLQSSSDILLVVAPEGTSSQLKYDSPLAFVVKFTNKFVTALHCCSGNGDCFGS